MAVTHFRTVKITKEVLNRAEADISNQDHCFSYSQFGAKIFEFKEDPVPKRLDKKTGCQKKRGICGKWSL